MTWTARVRRFAIFLIGSTLLVILSLILQAMYLQPPTVWVVHSLARVGQYDPPGENQRVMLYAARGECESFQVVVRDASRTLTSVNVFFQELVGPYGAVISESDITFYREHYIYVAAGSKESPARDRLPVPGWYPDALIPFRDPMTQQPIQDAELRGAPFDLAPGKNQPVWVDVCISRDAVPGAYHGELIVASDQGIARLPMQVHVWNFELPLRPSLQSAFTIYNDTISQPPIFHASLRANQETLLRHKLMPVPVNPEHEREYIDKLGLNLAHLAFYPFATWGNCVQPPAPTVAELQEKRAAHQPDAPVFLQIADEVSECHEIFPILRGWARNAHAAAVLTLLTAIPIQELRDDGSGTGRSAADIWVLLPKQFVSHPQEVAAAREKGDQVWAYTALVQDDFSPKWALDFAPIHYRILGGFLNQSHGLRGLLYWSVNAWGQSPHNAWYRAPNLGPDGTYPPGEGMLVYPGEKAGVAGFVPSMRLKWIRDSVEDYEYIEILKRLNREEWAMDVVRAAATDWHTWTREFEVLQKARNTLGQEIDRLSTAR
jgi:hypothetical protein